MSTSSSTDVKRSDRHPNPGHGLQQLSSGIGTRATGYSGWRCRNTRAISIAQGLKRKLKRDHPTPHHGHGGRVRGRVRIAAEMKRGMYAYSQLRDQTERINHQDWRS